MRSADRVDLVLRDVTLLGDEGRRVAVAVHDGRVVAVEASLSLSGLCEYDGHGAALLPGLHDHHLHLLATAAVAGSVDCSDATTLDELGARLRAGTPRAGWVRAVGHHEARVGRLTRDLLDALMGPERATTPVRVRDHSGALWVLNSAALAALGPLPDTPDVERDGSGRVSGRLWRLDHELGARVGRTAPDLAALGAELARLGITGVTDATPDLPRATVDLLDGARRTDALPQRVHLLGAATAAVPETLTVGPAKIHLRDHDLPTVDELAARVTAHHRTGRPVAVHCLGVEALVLTLAALEDAGHVPGDRIEHASVVPPALLPRLRATRVQVVTQPGFLSARGDDLVRDVGAAEQAWLWPWAGLRAAGIPVCGASDAPHGPLSPWQVIAAAADRRTPSGRVVGAGERVPASLALGGYLTHPEAPAGSVRRIVPGAPADLVLLHGPLEAALAGVPANPVRLTVVAGRVVHDAG
ncbi:amidohydrolase family protein [Nocardioides ochotonae]|uniref:amidohydrolase family protein n=1 Tax=Nocardioides ochotonae TaxID=2685869 RepID=UPI0014079D55|nr:amidohydrolase family protein [Nocardioides ochotonae]